MWKGICFKDIPRDSTLSFYFFLIVGRELCIDVFSWVMSILFPHLYGGSLHKIADTHKPIDWWRKMPSIFREYGACILSAPLMVEGFHPLDRWWKGSTLNSPLLPNLFFRMEGGKQPVRGMVQLDDLITPSLFTQRHSPLISSHDVSWSLKPTDLGSGGGQLWVSPPTSWQSYQGQFEDQQDTPLAVKARAKMTSPHNEKILSQQYSTVLITARQRCCTISNSERSAPFSPFSGHKLVANGGNVEWRRTDCSHSLPVCKVEEPRKKAKGDMGIMCSVSNHSDKIIVNNYQLLSIHQHPSFTGNNPASSLLFPWTLLLQSESLLQNLSATCWWSHIVIVNLQRPIHRQRGISQGFARVTPCVASPMRSWSFPPNKNQCGTSNDAKNTKELPPNNTSWIHCGKHSPLTFHVKQRQKTLSKRLQCAV